MLYNLGAWTETCLNIEILCVCCIAITPLERERGRIITKVLIRLPGHLMCAWNKVGFSHDDALFISSPAPSVSQGELIVNPLSRHPSVVGRPPFSKIFSETTWPIKAKFYV